jgi:hypothetical protein
MRKIFTKFIATFLSFGFCITVITQHPLFAQGGYVTVGVGYGLSAGSQQLESKNSATGTGTGTSTNREGIYGSFGQGLKFGATGGYMFSPNVGAELGFLYLIGNSFEGGSSSTTSTSTDKRSGSGFMVAPAIVIAGSGTVMPYAKAGVVFGFLKVKNESLSSSTFGQTQSRSETAFEETGGVAIGYAGGVGVVFASGGQVNFFAEVAIVNMAYSPSQAELTKATLNGVDQLPQIPNKKADYKDNYNSNDQNVLPGVREPFGSVGVNVGVRVNL